VLGEGNSPLDRKRPPLLPIFLLPSTKFSPIFILTSQQLLHSITALAFIVTSPQIRGSAFPAPSLLVRTFRFLFALFETAMPLLKNLSLSPFLRSLDPQQWPPLFLPSAVCQRKAKISRRPSLPSFLAGFVHR
jgi:hypothetical protein